MIREEIVTKIKNMLLKGEIAPWKAEAAALKEGISNPKNITTGVMARRAFIEEKSGCKFHHIVMPEKPYHVAYRCPNDATLWTLATDDTYIRCGICGTPLEMLDEKERHQPLVNNYIGGIEDYYSYAGEVTVGGGVNKTFQNILCWGPGIGHLGISVGCFKLNKYGPVDVRVSDWGLAARNLTFVFNTEDERESAKNLIKENLTPIIQEITRAQLSEWNGEIYDVDFLYKQHHGDFFCIAAFIPALRIIVATAKLLMLPVWPN